MNTVTFYGYARCGTCKKAQRWLDERSVSYRFVDITTHPPSQALLKRAMASGIELGKLYNTSGKAYRSGDWKQKRQELSRADQIRALAGNGRLIKRPIVSDGTRVTVGFREEAYATCWGTDR